MAKNVVMRPGFVFGVPHMRVAPPMPKRICAMTFVTDRKSQHLSDTAAPSAANFPVAIYVTITTKIAYDYHDVEQQRQLVFDEYSSARGWKVAEMLDALKKSEDFYFDSASQVHMDRWSSGRVVLLGDSAFAPSFFSGQGTSLAMIGADVLATEWATGDGNLDRAFGRYEQAMRPQVDRAPTALEILGSGSSDGLPRLRP
ncbi:hypothetical protein ACIA8C_13210 [Nocardia sp. NPDC051321]|uniref:hypothetical protein n=1 Tax=Nocardia sp. NPDC051321 TaxID=3364323 RepID=UPI00379AD7EE